MVTGIRVLAAHQVGEGTPLVVTKTTTEQIQTVQDSDDPVQGLMAAVHQVGRVVDRQVTAVGNPPPVEVVVTRPVTVVGQIDHLPVDRLPEDRLLVDHRFLVDHRHQVTHQTMTRKTSKKVFAVMTPFGIKTMFQIMRTKQTAVTRGNQKMILITGFLQEWIKLKNRMEKENNVKDDVSDDLALKEDEPQDI